MMVMAVTESIRLGAAKSNMLVARKLHIMAELSLTATSILQASVVAFDRPGNVKLHLEFRLMYEWSMSLCARSLLHIRS